MFIKKIVDEKTLKEKLNNSEDKLSFNLSKTLTGYLKKADWLINSFKEEETEIEGINIVIDYVEKKDALKNLFLNNVFVNAFVDNLIYKDLGLLLNSESFEIIFKNNLELKNLILNSGVFELEIISRKTIQLGKMIK